MRNSLIIISFFSGLLIAQPSFSAADIDGGADGGASVIAADMDGDGDMDIVSASKSEDTIAWYENNGAADPSWSSL